MTDDDKSELNRHGACPTCGHCKCCERKTFVYPLFPTYPVYHTYPPYPVYPWYSTTFTVEGTVSND